jgi:hypothetical protein
VPECLYCMQMIGMYFIDLGGGWLLHVATWDFEVIDK